MSDPTPAGDLVPKLERAPDGTTRYRCAQGHAHDFMSVAVACDLGATLPEADEWPDGSIGRKPQ